MIMHDQWIDYPDERKMITYFYPAMTESLPLPGERTVGKYLRKCNEICEILTPRVFYAVRQDDNAFW
jgi:hypothetical protein